MLKSKRNKLQRQTDYYVKFARELSSRGTSFWIAVVGVILQAAHTTLLMYNISSFPDEWQKILVSAGAGIVISSALLVFTLKHKIGNKESETQLLIFFYFEVFVGAFYYIDKLIFKVHRDTGEWPGLDNYILLFIGLPFAYIVPYTIKQFAYVIKSDQTLEFGEIDILPTDETVSQLNESSIDQRIDELKSQLIAEIDDKTEQAIKQIDERSSDINVTEIFDKVDAKIKATITEVLNSSAKGTSLDAEKLTEFTALLTNAKDIIEDAKQTKESTKKILKTFRTEYLDKLSDFDPKDYIKRGEKISVRMPNTNDQKDLQISQQ